MATPFPHRARTAGFTLVELMVAITGGLFVSIVVFMMARDGSRFYQRESRVADATLGAMVGFERLRNDISRAAYMASPNILRDPALCGDPAGDATWPAELKHLAGLRIDTPALSNSTLTNNGLQPDRIELAGSYSSVDEFPMWGVTDDGTNYIVSLQTKIGPLARMNYANAGNQLAILQQLFPAGRGLRIVDRSGKVQYGMIDPTNGWDVANTDARLKLVHNSPALRFRTANATACGLRLNETGYVNVVNFVRYEVKSVASSPRYAPIFANSTDIPFEGDRTELVRTELDAHGDTILDVNGQEINEIVAEYAVDMKLGVTAVTAIVNSTESTMTAFAPGDAQVLNWAGDSTSITAPNGPQRVRTVRVRLSVRSREADRDQNIADPGAGVPFPAGIAPGLYRIALGASGTTGPYARVRTLQADVNLANQVGVLW